VLRYQASNTRSIPTSLKGVEQSLGEFAADSNIQGVVGAQVYVLREDVPQITDWRSSYENGPLTGGAGAGVWSLPQAGQDNPFLGTTDTAHCRWYFGEKIASGGARPELNDPAGALGDIEGIEEEPDPAVPAPVDVEEPCHFSITDPGSWLSGGMCAAVGLLAEIFYLLGDILGAIGALAQAIGGLAASIAEAIAGVLGEIVQAVEDLLKTLFIPPDGYFEGKVAGMQDAWDQTSPAKYLDALDGLVPGSITGCEGLPLNVALPGGIEVDERLGEACDGKMASVAALVRIALSLVLVFAGGLAVLRNVIMGIYPAAGSWAGRVYDS
jgi:hypothetical protein